MNPLPFFPPPARAFSHTGRETQLRERPGNSRHDSYQGNHGQSSSPRPRSLSNLNFSSLRITSTHHGTGSSSSNSNNNTSTSGSHASSSTSGPGKGSSSQSSRPKTDVSRRAPGTPPHATRNTSISQRLIRPTQTADNSPAHTGGRNSPQDSEALSNSAPDISNSSGASTIMGDGRADSGSNSSGETTPAMSASPRAPSYASPRLASSWNSSHSSAQSRSSSATSSQRHPSRSNSSALSVPWGRTGTNLPKGLFFDYVRAEEVSLCHVLESRAYDAEDQASRDRMRYRQKAAPHLFIGAFIPSAPPKVAGPLSVGHYSTPRKLIAYANATASSNLSAHSLVKHEVSNPDEGVEAWLVCLHSIVVDEAYRRKGLGLRLLEEFMMRIRRFEEGRGDARKGELEKPKGYECVALLCHQESLRFFRKAGFQLQGISHVRCGSGGWIEMRRKVKGNHHEESGSQSELSTSPSLNTEGLAIASPAEPDWKFSASPVAVENTGAPLAAFPTGTGRHEREPPQQTEIEVDPATEDVVSETPAITSADPDDDTPREEKSQSALSASPRSTSQSNNDGLGGLGGFSQASLMAALAASSKGYAPGTNPSLPFSSVLGQTLAGKTFVEDAFIALEARLVDRRKGKEDEPEGEGSNLAEIWCPREECGCKIIRKGVAIWELAESGPLSDPKLSVESLPGHASPLPPTPQPPPAPASHIRALKEREREGLKSKKEGEQYSTRSTLPGAPPSHETSTPIRPFWSLLNPMSFENVAFSKDVKWTPPSPADRDEEGTGTPGASGFSRHGSRTPPDESGNASSGSGQGVPTPSKDKVRKPTRRPTFFSKKDKDKDRSNESGSSGLQISHPHRMPESSLSGGSPVTGSPPPASQTSSSSSSSPRELTIKYILCGNCETGPLGYVIIPPKMTDGRLGEHVGNELNGGGGGGAAPGTPSGMQDLQIYLLAAERVRYRFVKS